VGNNNPMKNDADYIIGWAGNYLLSKQKHSALARVRNATTGWLNQSSILQPLETLEAARPEMGD